MPTFSFTQEAATWEAKKVIDLVSNIPDKIALARIGTGVTPPPADRTMTDAGTITGNELTLNPAGRVTGTVSSPANQITRIIASAVLGGTGSQDLDALAWMTTDVSTDPDPALYMIMVLDQVITGLNPGAQIDVTLSVNQLASEN